MIENVARALAQSWYGREVDDEFLFGFCTGGDAFVRQAQAAIAAMREPTEGMLDASWHQAGESKEMRARTHHHYWRHYQAMIDAALSDATTDREAG